MNIQKIIETAKKHGFKNAEVINTDKIVFNFDFRKYCEENLCGNYNNNYSCPDSCPSPQEMKDSLLKYSNALVVQSVWSISDLGKKDEILKAKSEHNKSMLGLIKIMKENGHLGIMAGASECSLCFPCEKASGNECRYPNLRFSCLSAYCINVMLLAKECCMDYQYKDGMLSFYGIYVF
ncbi:MAG: DUF2284 domain-containing protein [Ruminococcaceae bacterium]|nr:DUF2284 domain-containing protein [Oscillospiraceae bacterium]